MTLHLPSVLPACDRPSQPRETPAVSKLSAQAERVLCRRWRDRHDASAAELVVGDSLRIAAEIAAAYGKIYGVRTDDLIGECYVELMRALSRFDPDCGERFATYAIPRMHAAVQEFILRRRSSDPSRDLLVRSTKAKSRRSPYGPWQRLPEAQPSVSGGMQ